MELTSLVNKQKAKGRLAKKDALGTEQIILKLEWILLKAKNT